MLHYLTYTLAFSFGCLSTFYLPFSAVLSSCLVGLIGSFFPFPKEKRGDFSAAIYSGSFAGMSSEFVFSHVGIIFAVSLFGGIIFTLLINRLKGIGGKLGTVAFLSVFIILIVRKVIV